MIKKAILAGVISCLVLIGCNNTAVEENVVDESTNRDVEILEVEGNIRGKNISEIYIDFPIVISSVEVQEGEKVKKGNILATFSMRDFEDTLLQKQKQLELLQVEFKKLEATEDPLVAEIVSIKEKLQVQLGYKENGSNPELQMAQTELVVAKEQMRIAEEAYIDNQKLHEVGGVSAKEIEYLKQSFLDSQAAVENLQTSINNINTESNLLINELETQIESMNMQIKNNTDDKLYSKDGLKVQIELLELEISNYKSKLDKPYVEGNNIIADKDNMIIYEISCVQGSRVGEVTQTIMKSVLEDELIATIEVPTEDMGLIKMGDYVEIQGYAGQQEKISGHINRIPESALYIDGDTVVKVDVVLEEGKEFIKSGMEIDGLIYLD